MSYGNWKHILGVFSFHNSVFNGISVIKHTLRDPLVRSTTTFDPSFFFFFLFFTKFGEVVFFFFFFYFSFQTGLLLLPFFFSLSCCWYGLLHLPLFFFLFFFHWVSGFSSSSSSSSSSFFLSSLLTIFSLTNKQKPTNMCIHTKKKLADLKNNLPHQAAVHIGEMGVVHRWRSWRGEGASEIFMGLGLCFRRDGCCCCSYCCCCCYCFCFVVEADFVNRMVWPLYRNWSHKKVEKLSGEKVSEVCQTGGYRKLGYFKWWAMNDENWVRSDE